MHPYRTHTCGELSTADVDQRVRLAGWLHDRRNLGGILFVDLRDHYGITQLLLKPGNDAYEHLAHCPRETVLRVDGTVRARGDENVNPDLATGEVELEVDEIAVLGPAGPLPFSVVGDDKIAEELRLRYRFLDLRRSRMHHNTMLRSKVVSRIRKHLEAQGFTEFQTPILTSSSPEGARDFIVPSRLHPGRFFALPQAPQQFKQLLMASGFDRYFQIAPCFRDEDGRADRSPGEFYQIDLEMSFVEQDEVFTVVEDLFVDVFTEFAPDRPVSAPFPRITYREALAQYGTDKPDLRIPLMMHDLSAAFAASSVRAFAGKHVIALPVSFPEQKSRGFLDQLETWAVERGLSGLAWLRWNGSELSGPLAKHLSAEETEAIVSLTSGDATIFLSAGTDLDKLRALMGELRVHIGTQWVPMDEDALAFCWVIDFPMFEADDNGGFEFSHNPFSMPQGGREALDTLHPLEVLGSQYDIVCNGLELSSGAIRNHRVDVMYRAFEIAGYDASVVDEKFGAMVRAFTCGAPPHGGIAPGLDRIMMLLTREPNLRETIAFPLTQSAQDLMMGAPSTVTEEQLKTVHIAIKPGADRADG